jgi:tetratricopeptide (TPR) repeat protein
MSRRKNGDSLVRTIETALDLGRFVSERQSGDFVHDLEGVKSRVDALAAGGEVERSVRLYEMFLAACYEKAEEIDDSSGSLGMFFEDLFVSWIEARQKAGFVADETVRQVVGWMESDKYGFCHAIEKSVARILDGNGLAGFKKYFEDQLESAFKPFRVDRLKCIHDYPWGVRRFAEILKNIYVARKDVGAYVALCDKIAVSPMDCEEIADLYKGKRRFADALRWVEKGLSLETQRQWGNLSSHLLRSMREELLSKLGRTQDAFESAWAAFQKHPSVYGYADVMKYANRDDAPHWHDEAMKVARAASLSAFIEICTETKEWDALADRIASVAREEIEQISHYVTEKAANGLVTKHASAALKVYCALGTRILKAGKSKYYQHALKHFREAKRLAGKSSQERLWQDAVDEIRTQHSRKYGFIADFENLVAGTPRQPVEPFEERARKRWKKQTSG